MTSRLYSLHFGRKTLAFTAPPGWEIDVAAGRQTLSPYDDDETRMPYSYDEAIRRAERVVIVFTDATRSSPDRELAGRVLRTLVKRGVAENQIAFLCAVGMHRPSTMKEKLAKLGPEIVERFPVYDHDPTQVMTIGEIDGIPVQVNARLVEPGTLVVALGVVEPHQYAGYSGGAKTVVIGCGGPDTIAATHGPRYLDHPGTRLGNIEGNPFQQFVRQAGRMIGLRWVNNVILNSNNEVVDQWSGPPDIVHDALVARARRLYEVPVAAPYDVVIAGVGAPKDANLYQASRAATYIGLSSRPVIRPGGVIIMAASMPEGAGQGAGERNFIAALRRNNDLTAMMEEMRQVGCRPGEQRAYMLAQLLTRYRVIVVGARDADLIQAAHLTPAASMDEALALAQQWSGGPARGLLVSHALQTIPVPA